MMYTIFENFGSRGVTHETVEATSKLNALTVFHGKHGDIFGNQLSPKITLTAVGCPTIIHRGHSFVAMEVD